MAAAALAANRPLASVKGYEEKADRLTVGGGYSFGPGMTFRGAVAWGEKEVGSITPDATAARNPEAVAAGTA